MLKGYGKVEQHVEVEDQEQDGNPKSKPSKPYFMFMFMFMFMLISAISILTILLLTRTFHHHTDESNQQLLNSADSIRVVCNVTRFPHACIDAIPPSPNATDPKAILFLSLRASIHALLNLTSSIPTPTSRALSDCTDQLHDALGRLNDSLSALAAAAPITEPTLADVQTWLSAAVTDQETCLDGLEEVGDVAGAEEMKKLMQRSNEYTSNTLAIVANIPNLLRLFHMTLH